MNTWELLTGEQIHVRILNKEWDNSHYNIIYELHLDPAGSAQDDYITLFLNYSPADIAYNKLSYYLFFDKSKLRADENIEILNNDTQPTSIKIQDLDKTYIFYLLKMLLKNSQIDLKLGRQFVSNIAEQLLLLILINRDTKEAQVKLASVDRENTIAVKFVEHVKKHFLTHKTVGYYAKKMGITEKTLNKATQHSLRITPKDFIQQTLKQEAMMLLEQTDKSVKEISYLLGMKETNNFSSFFKKMTNMSPSEYRRLHAKKQGNDPKK